MKISCYLAGIVPSFLVTGASAFLAPTPSSSFSSLASTTAARPFEPVDEAKAFAASDFPIKPDDLIARAKIVLGPDVGIGTKDGGECLAEDFEFCAAVVGPIPREDYLNALGTFKLEESFAITQNAFGFTVDPLQPNRVWYHDRQIATHIAEFSGVAATGKELVLPPQVFHIDFNADGKIKEFGFYTSDRRQGNTGGIGGAFGYFLGVGKPLPFPEARPYKPSFRYRMLQKVGGLLQKLSKNKKKD